MAMAKRLFILCFTALAACGGDPGDTTTPARPAQYALLAQSAASDHDSVVQQLYVGYFGRPADPGGLAYFTNLYRQAGAPTTLAGLYQAYFTNPTVRALIDSFASSAESAALYPGDNASFVTAVYRNLFNREPDVAGKQYWVGVIDAGLLTRATAAIRIMDSARDSDATIIAKKTQVASLFSSSINNDERKKAYSGLAANVWVRTMLNMIGADANSALFQGLIDATIVTLVANQVDFDIVADSALGYRQLGQVAMSSIDPALAAATDLALSQESGIAVSAKVGSDKVLRYLSPAEQFGDSVSVLRVASKSAGKSARLTLKWRSRIGPVLGRVSEANADGQAPGDDGVTISVSGVGANGIVSPATAALSYRLSNAAVLDANKVRVSLNSLGNAQDVSSYFSLNAATATLALKADKLASVLASIQSAKVATLAVSLSSARYARTYGFEHALTYANGTINLKVQNADASAATGLAGTVFIARGFNSGFTASATLLADGSLQMTGLPADSYEVFQALLDSGVPLSGFATLPSAGATVALTIKKASGGTAAFNQRTAFAQLLAGAEQFDAAPPRAMEAASSHLVASAELPATSVYNASATAAARDTLITTVVNYLIPKGTGKVGLHVEVSSPEFPNYTGQQSQYNDLWMVNVQLPGNTVFNESGKVNQTHATVGTIMFDKCVDVAALTKDAPAPLSGQLGAQNVADSSLSTSVKLTVVLSCGALNITQFSGKSRATDGMPILFPITMAKTESAPDGNVAGQYMAMPIAAELPLAFGIPSTLKFDPADATPKEIELYQRTSGGSVSLGKTYLTQGKLEKPGQLAFASLRLKPSALTALSERVQIVAVLRATLSGSASAVESAPFPLTIDEKFSTFTPIYLMSELPSYNAANRYSLHTESGGDSWSTGAMANWLFANGLRYNDVSAANVKQTATGRSVLGHSGHSDAQQADLRYWDGSGGFSDTLGGADKGKGLATLAAAALNEVTTKATLKPNLDALVAWVTQNRTKLAGYAAKSEVRRIYVGNGHVSQLLIDGVFPANDAPVPGLTAWSAMPAKILPQEDHLDHWHVSTNRP